MSSRSSIPADLAAARRKFEKWRAGGRPRRRLPAELWNLAATLVATHGVYRVSDALRLDYYVLKARAEGRSAARPPRRTRGEQKRARGEQVPAFVQVAPRTAVAPLPGCTVELVDRDGRHMTIRSSTGLEPAALVAAFCGASR
jgi:hypothetical protein